MLALALMVPVSATADSRVFIIANQPDGYGIDQCLADGEPCGASAARAYCRSREFKAASAYRRVDPGEVADSTPASTRETCLGQACALAYVAITCER
ncbi:hypothetical protein RCO31_13060 [Bradyrhizobium sp. LHD-71]|nr:hypothetical protein [Bradyrhizobium sp. LHD-71]MDQ8728646.1 hypothetical protein [Bradyrhizobium sp. LHD-71]